MFAHINLFGVSARRVAQTILGDILPLPVDFALHQWCLEHVNHLIVEHGLKLAGKAWSGVAKIINCWRSQGSIAKLTREWTRAVGADSATIAFSSFATTAAQRQVG